MIVGIFHLRGLELRFCVLVSDSMILNLGIESIAIF